MVHASQGITQPLLALLLLYLKDLGPWCMLPAALAWSGLSYSLRAAGDQISGWAPLVSRQRSSGRLRLSAMRQEVRGGLMWG